VFLLLKYYVHTHSVISKHVIVNTVQSTGMSSRAITLNKAKVKTRAFQGQGQGCLRQRPSPVLFKAKENAKASSF